MLNNKLIDIFKRSLSITLKTIGKYKEAQINFVLDDSSNDKDKINLTLPRISTFKKNINYLRGEADSLALELRFHNSEIHNKFISKNILANKIFQAIEQSRCEAKGSIYFKGIQNNIINKHNRDLIDNNINTDHNEIISAFRYVSFGEFTEKKLSGKFSEYKKILKK